MIKVKRVYEFFDKRDGFRILVDRLWPRGLTKGKVKIDLWLGDIAPSDALRRWFNHEPEKWEEFKKRYFEELKSKTDLVKMIEERAEKGIVTLVYGAKDTECNNAIVLKEYLNKKGF